MNLEKVKMAVKYLLPWQLRYFIKLQEAKGNIYLPKGIKQKSDIKGYNDAFYEFLASLRKYDLSGNIFCEMGPGHFLTHAALAYQLGCEKAILLEIGDFAGIDTKVDFKDIQLKPGIAAIKKLPQVSGTEIWRQFLGMIDAEYYTDGIYGYERIVDDEVDYVYSGMVLEHVRKNIFKQTLSQMYRFMKPGAVCFHLVDLRDHFGGKKNQLRFPEAVWEDKVHYRMDNYTNRLSCREICEIFMDTGFEIIRLKKRKFKSLPVNRKHLDAAFREYSDEDLLIAEFIIIARKPKEKRA